MKYLVSVNGESVEVEVDGPRLRADGVELEGSAVSIEGAPVQVVTLGNETNRVVYRRGGTRGVYTIWLDGFRFEIEALDERSRAIRALSEVSGGPAGPAPLVAPMPGLVVNVAVQAGDVVHPGMGLVIIEAMKMENELRAKGAGTVKAVLVKPGMAVEKGTILVELE
jgi:biotin carboxyl carrier protein